MRRWVACCVHLHGGWRCPLLRSEGITRRWLSSVPIEHHAARTAIGADPVAVPSLQSDDVRASAHLDAHDEREFARLFVSLCLMGVEYIETHVSTSPVVLEDACHRLMMHLARRFRHPMAAARTHSNGTTATQRRSWSPGSGEAQTIDVQLEFDGSSFLRRRRRLVVRLADMPAWLTQPIAACHPSLGAAEPTVPHASSRSSYPYALFAGNNDGIDRLASDVRVHQLEQLLYALRHLRQQHGKRSTTNATTTWMEGSEVVARAEALLSQRRHGDRSANRGQRPGSADRQPVRVVTLRHSVVDLCEAIAFRVLLYKGFALREDVSVERGATPTTAWEPGPSQHRRSSPNTNAITAVHTLRRVLGWEANTFDTRRLDRSSASEDADAPRPRPSCAAPVPAFPLYTPTVTATLVSYLALQACSLDDLYQSVPSMLLVHPVTDGRSADDVSTSFRRGVRMALLLHFQQRWAFALQHDDHGDEHNSCPTKDAKQPQRGDGDGRHEEAATTTATQAAIGMKHLTRFIRDRLQHSRRLGTWNGDTAVQCAHAWPKFTSEVDDIVMLWFLVLAVGPSLERLRPRAPPRIWERLIHEGIVPVFGWVLMATVTTHDAPHATRVRPHHVNSNQHRKRHDAAAAVAWMEWGAFARAARLRCHSDDTTTTLKGTDPTVGSATTGAAVVSSANLLKLSSTSWPQAHKDKSLLRAFLLHCYQRTLHALTTATSTAAAGGGGATTVDTTANAVLRRFDARVRTTQHPTTACAEHDAAPRSRHPKADGSANESVALAVGAFFLLRGSLLRMGVFASTDAACHQLERDTNWVVTCCASDMQLLAALDVPLPPLHGRSGGTHHTWAMHGARLTSIASLASAATFSDFTPSPFEAVDDDDGVNVGHTEPECSSRAQQCSVLDLLDTSLVRSVAIDAHQRQCMEITKQLLLASATTSAAPANSGGGPDTAPPGVPPFDGPSNQTLTLTAQRRNGQDAAVVPPHIPTWVQVHDMLRTAVHNFIAVTSAGCLDHPAFVPSPPFSLVVATVFARISEDGKRSVAAAIPPPSAPDVADTMAHLLAYMHWCALYCGGVSYSGLWSFADAVDPAVRGDSDTGRTVGDGGASVFAPLTTWRAVPIDDRQRVMDGIHIWFVEHMNSVKDDDGLLQGGHCRQVVLLRRMTTVSLLRGVRMGMFPLQPVAVELARRWGCPVSGGGSDDAHDGVDAIACGLEREFFSLQMATGADHVAHDDLEPTHQAQDGVQDLLASWVMLSLESPALHDEEAAACAAVRRTMVAMIALRVCSNGEAASPQSEVRCGAVLSAHRRARRRSYLQLLAVSHGLAIGGPVSLPAVIGRPHDDCALVDASDVVVRMLSASPRWNPHTFLVRSMHLAQFCTSQSASSPDLCVSALVSLLLSWDSLVGCAGDAFVFDAIFGSDERRVRLVLEPPAATVPATASAAGTPLPPNAAGSGSAARRLAARRLAARRLASLQNALDGTLAALVQLLRRALLSVELSTTSAAPSGGSGSSGLAVHPTVLSSLVCAIAFVHCSGMLWIEDVQNVLGMLARTWSGQSASASGAVSGPASRKGTPSLDPSLDVAAPTALIRCALLFPVPCSVPLLSWLSLSVVQLVRQLTVLHLHGCGDTCGVGSVCVLSDAAVAARALSRIAAVLACDSEGGETSRLERQEQQVRPPTHLPHRPVVHQSLRIAAYQLLTWWLYTAAPRLGLGASSLGRPLCLRTSPLSLTGSLVTSALSCSVVLRGDEMLCVYATLSAMMANHGQPQRRTAALRLATVVELGHVAAALVALRRSPNADGSRDPLVAQMHAHTVGGLKACLLAALVVAPACDNVSLTGQSGGTSQHAGDLSSAFDAFANLWVGDKRFWTTVGDACDSGDETLRGLKAVVHDAQRRACILT